MTDCPTPFTPPDCDVRGMPYMPLDIVRLFSSRFYALSNGDQFKAGLTLWCRAFQQEPAGSLPDDDRELAYLSGAGSQWKRVKEMALHGWVKCSDGRLYHRIVAEKVCEAWESRLRARARTEAARAARQAHKVAPNSGTPPPVTTSVTEPVTHNMRLVTMSVTEPVTESVTASKVQLSKGKEEEEGSEANASDAADAASAPPGNPRDQIWSEGLSLLRGLTGQSDRAARSSMGKLLRDANDDCAKVYNALWDAKGGRPIDPLAWLIAAVRPEKPRKPGYNAFLDPDFDEIPSKTSRLALDHVH